MIVCEVCGFEFDPIGCRWACPSCRTHHPCCEGAALPERGCDA